MNDKTHLSYYIIKYNNNIIHTELNGLQGIDDDNDKKTNEIITLIQEKSKS